MSSKELIERAQPLYADSDPIIKELADALELADKRIAELEQVNCSRLDEAERKLAVAREACKDIRRAIERECYAAAYIIVSEALAQIGGEE